MSGFKEKYGMNVAVIGASPDRERYSNKAVRAFMMQGFKVFPVNPNETEIEGLKSYPSVADISDRVDFVSVYLRASISLSTKIPEQLHSKNVKAAIINPGSESDLLIEELTGYDIEPLMICSIRSLGYDPSEL